MRQTLALAPAVLWRLARIGGRLALWRRNLTTRRSLADLPPHLLRDVGITEAQARREARRAFWQ